MSFIIKFDSKLIIIYFCLFVELKRPSFHSIYFQMLRLSIYINNSADFNFVCFSFLPFSLILLIPFVSLPHNHNNLISFSKFYQL